MLYFPEQKAIIFSMSSFEKWEGKTTSYSCAQS